MRPIGGPPGQTSSGATTVANNDPSQCAVSGGTVTITPAVTASTLGYANYVTIIAPTSSNLCMPPFMVGQAIGNIAATVVMNHQ